jgi:LacI family transcriptional regulator
VTSTTVRRIAQQLGVSTTTASKVLNDHTDIGPTTRARVLARVEQLGYRPNAVARSLSLRRTHTLGVVIPDLMHSFFVEVISAIESISSDRGYGLILCSSGEDAHKERRELEMLRGRQVDGIVVASADPANTDVLRRLVALGTAVVMIDRDDHPKLRCHRVLTDDDMVGRLATEHLIAAGRKSIAHLAGPPFVHARRRTAGYRKALAAHGLRVRPELVIGAGFLESGGYEAMKRLLDARTRVDAVFAANDPTAIGAMKAIWEAGLRVPDDIAVVGAGDIWHGDLLRVPLTTIAWSKDEMGRRAAELMLDQITSDRRGPAQRIIVRPRLVVRKSCGAHDMTNGI